MAIGSYMIGSINFSIIISRMKGRDIRNVGSGNPGMMNMSRNFGLKTGVAILALDMLKGIVPTFVGWVVFRGATLGETPFVIADMSKYLCGFFAVSAFGDRFCFRKAYLL
jgi:glycerol-3-phosphate acyltransferase PlsY